MAKVRFDRDAQRVGGARVNIDGGGLGPRNEIARKFRVDAFEATEGAPFTDVMVSWRIAAIDDIAVEDAEFRLIGPPHPLIAPISATGEMPVHLVGERVLSLQVKGSRWETLRTLTVTPDTTGCHRVPIPTPMLDRAIFGSIEEFTDATPEVRTRKELTTPKHATWTTRGVTYDLPLEIVINNFFNADLDVDLQLDISVSHDDAGADLVVDADITLDVDYDWYEHLGSFGISKLVDGGVTKLVRVLLRFLARRAEDEVGAELYDAAKALVDEGDMLLDVEILPGVRTIVLIFCPLPASGDAPDAARRGDVVVPV